MILLFSKKPSKKEKKIFQKCFRQGMQPPLEERVSQPEYSRPQLSTWTCEVPIKSWFRTLSKFVADRSYDLLALEGGREKCENFHVVAGGQKVRDHASVAVRAGPGHIHLDARHLKRMVLTLVADFGPLHAQRAYQRRDEMART